MKNRSEKSILNETLVAVTSLPNACAWRNNTGSAWQGRRVQFYPGTQIPVPPNVVVLVDARLVSFGLEGSGDIIGAVSGVPVAIETKTKTGTQREQQAKFEKAWVRAGGKYLLVRDPVEAVEGILL